MGVVNPTGPLYVGIGTSFRKFKILGHTQRAAPNPPIELLADGTKIIFNFFFVFQKNSSK